MRNSSLIVKTLAAAFLVPVGARAQGEALTHVNVVNVVDGTIERDRTVLLDRGLIRNIISTAAGAIPKGARVRDMRGAYVIPGLWDMHAHLGSSGRSSLPLYVAAGVTGVRDMGSIPEVVRPWRDSIETGRLIGPRLLLASPIVENGGWLDVVRGFARRSGDSSLIRDLARRIPVSTPLSARQAVDSAVSFGTDFLKIRNDPPPPALFALLRRARERKFMVAGHWPSRISPAEASDSGYRSLEHGALSVSNGQLGPTLDRMSAEQRRALFARFASNRTAYTPTITSLVGFRLTPDSVVAKLLADTAGILDARRRYVDRRLLSVWKADFELKLQETGAPLDWSSFQKSWLRDLREMADAGVLLLAGTDTGSPLVFPGFSLSDELEAMVKQGGLTPLQSLRTATINVARWLGAEREFGSVSAGRWADLVILDGNPLEDIANVRRIRAVVRAGRVLDRATLDEILVNVQRAARTGLQPASKPDASYGGIVDRAQGALDSQRWDEAARLFKQTLALNPYVPEHWYALGRALYNGNKQSESIAPFKRAIELGAGRAYNGAWNIARAYAHAGEREQAFQWLARALDFGLRSREAVRSDPEFEKYRGDPRFRELADSVDISRMSPAEGRRHDLELLVAEVRRMHRDPNRRIAFAPFETYVRALEQRAGGLSNNQFAVAVMRALALLGSGHTGSTPESVTEWGDRAVPVQFFDFAEGVHIVAADTGHVDLLGARVLRVGNRDISEVRPAIDSLIGKDHPLGGRANLGRWLRYPQVANALGFSSSGDTLSLTVQTGNGDQRRVEIAAQPTGAGYVRYLGRPDWVQAYSTFARGAEVPLYLRHPETNYWFTILPTDRTLYFQFNRVRNAGEEPLETFLQRMFESADSASADRLVIDLRWNNGGNTFLLTPLLRGVMSRDRFSRRGGLFVIIGRNTFSAAQNAATLLDRYANPIFVGEPTGSSPNFVGEDNFFTLPFAKMAVGVSDLYWQSSWPQDERVWIAPLLFAPPTWASYTRNLDPAMSAIREHPR